MRNWLGFAARPIVTVPYLIAVLIAAYPVSLAGLFGWRSPARVTAFLQLAAGVVGNPEPWSSTTGIKPKSLADIFATMPAGVQERRFARLYLFKALAIMALAAFWFATGMIALGPARTRIAIADLRGAIVERLVIPTEPTAGPQDLLSQIAASVHALVRRAQPMLGETYGDILHATYVPDATYGSAFGGLFARIFAEQGLILLDPLDERLHRVASPLLGDALARRDELNASLLERGKELERAGYEPQVKVTSRSTLLFSMEQGKRRVLTATDGEFSNGTESVAREEWLRRVGASVRVRSNVYCPRRRLSGTQKRKLWYRSRRGERERSAVRSVNSWRQRIWPAPSRSSSLPEKRTSYSAPWRWLLKNRGSTYTSTNSPGLKAWSSGNGL